MEELSLGMFNSSGLFDSNYLVAQLNIIREQEGKSTLLHKNFIRAIEDEFSGYEHEPKIEPMFKKVETAKGASRDSKYYLLTHDQAIRVLSRESKVIRAIIINLINKQHAKIVEQQKELERRKGNPSLVKEYFGIHRLKSKESTTKFHEELNKIFASNSVIRSKYRYKVDLFISVHTNRINLSLFGYTAKQWREAFPEEAKTTNMRDNSPISTIAMIPIIEQLYIGWMVNDGIYDINELGWRAYDFANKLSDTYTYLDDAEELTMRQLNNREAYKRKLKFAFKRQEELPAADGTEDEIEPLD